MQLNKIDDVRLLIACLNNINEDAAKVVQGNVDATIYGRYFGDQMLRPEKAMLQALALRYCARRAWREIQMMADHKIEIRSQLGIVLHGEKEVAYDILNTYSKDEKQSEAIMKALIYLFD